MIYYFCENIENMEEINLLKRAFYNQLDERNKRLYAGIEASRIGYYGVSEVSTLLNIHAHTVRQGKQDLLRMPSSPPSRIRKTGGGKKKNRAAIWTQRDV